MGNFPRRWYPRQMQTTDTLPRIWPIVVRSHIFFLYLCEYVLWSLCWFDSGFGHSPLSSSTGLSSSFSHTEIEFIYLLNGFSLFIHSIVSYVCSFFVVRVALHTYSVHKCNHRCATIPDELTFCLFFCFILWKKSSHTRRQFNVNSVVGRDQLKLCKTQNHKSCEKPIQIDDYRAINHKGISQRFIKHSNAGPTRRRRRSEFRAKTSNNNNTRARARAPLHKHRHTPHFRRKSICTWNSSFPKYARFLIRFSNNSFLLNFSLSDSLIYCVGISSRWKKDFRLFFAGDPFDFERRIDMTAENKLLYTAANAAVPRFTVVGQKRRRRHIYTVRSIRGCL